MTEYVYIEESKTIPKWFQKHHTETCTVLVQDVWTDVGLLRIEGDKKNWFKVTEENGLATFTEIEPQSPSIVIIKNIYTKTYCNSNTFFNYWFITSTNNNITYFISSKSSSRLSKYKNYIQNIDLGCVEVDLEDYKYY